MKELTQQLAKSATYDLKIIEIFSQRLSTQGVLELTDNSCVNIPNENRKDVNTSC